MNRQSQECHWWGRVWSIWWDSSFHHLDDQAKNTIGQRSTVLVERPPWKSQEFNRNGKYDIWAKIILSLDICVKYAQCLKIWPFFWNLDFHWIFVWNMLNVWKYDHLCENLTFIEYLCEICSTCENMVIWYLGSVSEVCAVSEVLCSVSDGHYTEYVNCSVSDDEKGRHVLWGRVSYLRERKTCPCNACLPFS
jgi:hypothetical protein